MIILFFLFIPVVLSIQYSFRHTESVLQEKTSGLILDNLQQIGNKVENVSLDIMKISSIMGSDKIITSNLVSPDESITLRANGIKDFYSLSSEDVFRVSNIERQINNLKSSIFYNYSTNVIIFGNDGGMYSSLDNFNDEFKFKLEYSKVYKDQEWYRALMSGRESILWMAPFTYNSGDIGAGPNFITVARAIKINYSQNISGIILVSFSEDNFKPILGDTANGIISLLNENKQVIFSSDAAKAEKQLKLDDVSAKIPGSGRGYFFSDFNNRKFMINYYTIERFGWSLVSVIPYNDVTKEINSLKIKTYLINMVVFILFLIISVGMILYFISPLKRLINNIRKMRIGEYHVGLKNEDHPDDVSGIVRSFDFLFKQVEELVDTVIEEQKREHELRYEALRAQINPHFLFNTLNTIKWTAMMSGASNVSRMISSLGKLLEISINKGEEEITFKEELELVEAYVYIQNVRYNNKFILETDMDKSIYEFRILKLILQPIVENCIIHGFQNKTGEGHIWIKASRLDDVIRIDITDDGKGILEDKLEQILNDNSFENKSQKFSGIGLKNVNERIKLKYGSEFGLKIHSKVKEGTTITILLPAIE